MFINNFVSFPFPLSVYSTFSPLPISLSRISVMTDTSAVIVSGTMSGIAAGFAKLALRQVSEPPKHIFSKVRFNSHQL